MISGVTLVGQGATGASSVGDVGSLGVFAIGGAGWVGKLEPFQISTDGNVSAQAGAGWGAGFGAGAKLCQQMTLSCSK